MTPWPAPSRSALPPRNGGAVPPLRVHDSASGKLVDAAAGDHARMYVCGITPYDAAHLGHANTYVTFDVLHRVLLDEGRTVEYVQNVTDVDDPLLERATATGEDWRGLAARQTTLFADQMAALAVLPPHRFLGVTEVIDRIAVAVTGLLGRGAAYEVAAADGDVQPDVYFDVAADPRFGSVANLDPDEMLAVFAERGGDPARPGKRSPLDPLLWRAARPGEPSWAAPGLPDGRPGWHIECVAIVLDHLGMGFDVQGGGSDLTFPHHEMGASHARLLTGEPDYARAYVHSGMVGLDGEKMSKSKGNLVFVHEAIAGGLEPAALRVALLDHHYRDDWSWSGALGTAAATRVARWRVALGQERGPSPARVLHEVRAALADDLDTVTALAAVDDWCDEQLATGGPDQAGPGVVGRLLDSLLGVRL